MGSGRNQSQRNHGVHSQLQFENGIWNKIIGTIAVGILIERNIQTSWPEDQCNTSTGSFTLGVFGT